jgi:hypothetical protein
MVYYENMLPKTLKYQCSDTRRLVRQTMKSILSKQSTDTSTLLVGGIKGKVYNQQYV